jgi:DNA-binding transcriptional ArsR family regulator
MTQPQPIHDPAHIKALAHPIRLALLDFLGSVPQATATQCAEAIKESVASCSFHLRTLAKHGYIEQADAPDARASPGVSYRPIAVAHSNPTLQPKQPQSPR